MCGAHSCPMWKKHEGTKPQHMSQGFGIRWLSVYVSWGGSKTASREDTLGGWINMKMINKSILECYLQSPFHCHWLALLQKSRMMIHRVWRYPPWGKWKCPQLVLVCAQRRSPPPWPLEKLAHGGFQCGAENAIQHLLHIIQQFGYPLFYNA